MLREYYGAAEVVAGAGGTSFALAQVAQPDPTLGGKKFDATHGIIGILETAASDFTTLAMYSLHFLCIVFFAVCQYYSKEDGQAPSHNDLAKFRETEAQESEAQKAYEKFMQEAEVSKAKKEVAISGILSPSLF